MSNSTFSRLTEQQEEFAQHYAVHRKPSYAYRFAYNCENMQAQSVAVAAQQLLKHAYIALRIYELQTVAEEIFKVSVEEKKQWLYTIAKLSTKVIVRDDGEKVILGDPKAAIAAISELNKMDGDLAAQKKEFSGPGGTPIETRSMTKDEYKETRKEMIASDDC